MDRTATRDATILGHVIPKGTRIFLLINGHGINKPAFNIHESLRSKTYHDFDGGKAKDWNPIGMNVFNPDRWLTSSIKTDEKVFDPLAGPHLVFSSGPRGCFGKKLAYLELRLAIVLILWSFKLEKVPERFASWDAVQALTRRPMQCYIVLSEA